MPAHVTTWPSAQSWFVPLRGEMTRLLGGRRHEWLLARSSWWSLGDGDSHTLGVSGVISSSKVVSHSALE